MKGRNRILALAVGLAGGVAAQGAFAAASLYGQLNVSLDSLDNGSDSALNISSNSSRIGVKGDIQVGGDVAGIYQVESELRADDSTGGTLATRNTFLGLQGGFGTARLGKFDTPVKVIGRSVDLFADQVGDVRNLTRGANTHPVSSVTGTTGTPTTKATTNTQTRFDERPNNSIDYTTPEKAGFKGTLLYSTNADAAATATNDNDLISVAVNYAVGPAFVGLGYEKAGFLSTKTTANDATTILAQGDDPSVIRLAGYYDVNDAWRVNGFWQTVSGTAADGSLDEDVYGIGARFRSEAWVYKVQTYQLSADADNKDAGLVAVGAEYALQKGVTLYADYAATTNDDGRGLTPYKEGHGDNLAIASADNGDSVRAVSLGAVIKF